MDSRKYVFLWFVWRFEKILNGYWVYGIFLYFMVLACFVVIVLVVWVPKAIPHFMHTPISL
jgi:uncharacterized membrane protein